MFIGRFVIVLICISLVRQRHPCHGYHCVHLEIGGRLASGVLISVIQSWCGMNDMTWCNSCYPDRNIRIVHRRISLRTLGWKQLQGALQLLIPYRHGGRWGSKRWHILARRLNWRRKAQTVAINGTATVSSVSKWDIHLVILTGCIGVVRTIL